MSWPGDVYQKKVLLTEHGIYTREREEEIIRAKWVMATYKKQWISFFYAVGHYIQPGISGYGAVYECHADTDTDGL